MVKSVNTNKVEMDKKVAIAVVFENPEFGKIRTLPDENGEPLFCAKDVCDILGYKNQRDAIQRHVERVDVVKRDVKVSGSLRKDGTPSKRLQKMLYVNESGFYALVLGSKLSTAVKFKNWVTADVLPQIRKTGGYIPVQQGESDEETIRHAEEILRATLKEKENLLKKQRLQIEQQKKLIGEQDTEIRRLNDVVDEQVVRIAKNGENIIQLENQVGNLLPKALSSDNVLDSVSCFTTTQIAKELGITAQELNRSLCALHIQYYQSGQYLLSMPITPTWAWRRAAPATAPSSTRRAMADWRRWAEPTHIPISYGPNEDESSSMTLPIDIGNSLKSKKAFKGKKVKRGF